MSFESTVTITSSNFCICTGRYFSLFRTIIGQTFRQDLLFLISCLPHLSYWCFFFFLKIYDRWDCHTTNQFYLLKYTVKFVSMPISSCTRVTANLGRVKLLWSTQKPKSFFVLWWVRCQSSNQPHFRVWWGGNGVSLKNIALNACHCK